MRYREIQSGVVLDRGSCRGVTRHLRPRLPARIEKAAPPDVHVAFTALQKQLTR